MPQLSLTVYFIIPAVTITITLGVLFWFFRHRKMAFFSEVIYYILIKESLNFKKIHLKLDLFAKLVGFIVKHSTYNCLALIKFFYMPSLCTKEFGKM